MCAVPMVRDIEDFDYTRLAGLRGKIVVLLDVVIHRCERCGPTGGRVEISRLAELDRTLVAARTLRVDRLWCRFVEGEWTIVLEPKGKTQTKRAGRQQRR